MLSGLKFIPRDELERSQDEGKKERKKSKSSRRDKGKYKKRNSHYSSDEDHERIKSGSRKKKKWMDDEPSSSSDGSDDGSESDDSVKERSSSKRRREKKRGGNAKKKRRSRGKDSSEEYSSSGEDRSETQRLNDDSRKAMGLDFMLRPKEAVEKAAPAPLDDPLEFQSEAKEVKVNPRELNPYFKDNGSGYPEESGGKSDGKQLLSPVIGDGGASWRLKALKRSQEQAAREGRNFDEVVRERWGSVGELAVSAAAHKVAPVHAHLHAIKNRRRGTNEDERTNTYRQNEKDGSYHQSKMKIPKVQESLSWGKSKVSAADRSLSAAISTINKFPNDGSFMDKILDKKDEHLGDSVGSSIIETRELESKSKAIDDDSSVKALTANQLAAKVLQLRMKGKHEEAEKLQKEAENMKAKSDTVGEDHKPRIDGTSSRSAMHDFSARQKMKEEDTDLHLAQKIVRNQQFKISGQADDEYDYDDGPRKKLRSKQRGKDNSASEMKQVATFANRMLTQKERCQFCFENPERPKHLVVAIANFTYLSLPRWQPVAPGHCYILTLQHEASTRTVDDNVWDEMRNFKKCLIMMFAKQDKDVIFLETVVGLAQQRRHCLVECIPVPKNVAEQGPLYFKKAINEAESEWSQHNAKSIIETSQKGLRASIPKNFPYFHVEFGLSRGFVHVIDNEAEFESNFGLNVVRGMLRLPAEDMHSRRKSESFEMQKQSVASFARDWAPFDWTKQLG